MKVIKLDRRYAGSRKWKYALHFGTRKDGNLKRLQYVRVFAKLYGPDCWLNPDRKIFGPEPMWLYSDNWRDDIKRGRIYFNNESDLTMIELMK
jgi:hypothetical protein